MLDLRPYLLIPNAELGAQIRPPLRAFVTPLSTALDSPTASRLARSLGTAVARVAPAIRRPSPVVVAFGVPPYYAVDVGAGLRVYVADGDADDVGAIDEGTIYLPAGRLATLGLTPVDWAAVRVLEELVRAWMNVADQLAAKSIAAWLYGGLMVEDGEYALAEGLEPAAHRPEDGSGGEIAWPALTWPTR